MTKSGLVQRLLDRRELSSKTSVRSCVDLMLQSIGAALADGRRIEIRRFGTFAARARPPRLARLPHTGLIRVPAKRVPHFRASSALNDQSSRWRRLDAALARARAAG